ncbi:MAG: noncanonical pyrimidine nucleotidase, YjjG family [Lacrimispora celerecrescens]|uniref:YjjG family noncanonical pyrimidine nucleotidase n=1 Tax=Lacrimispora indolis TaxID=69825 RepID=UPI0004169EE8|nr:YjjG family noncanonical pyrimidine nucleotidase [[Clostridium] methoxybenzovorans]MBE7719070.1 noncanonical pyrimidine nucleotidase, YjjG family [Lacrimispora celerecrescens]
MYQIFLLDIDNTLLDFDAAEEQSFKKVIKSYDLEYKDEMLPQYKKMNRHLWDLLEQEKIGREELLNTRFSQFFRFYDLEISGEEAEGRYRRHLGNSSDLIPGATETLTRLKQMGKQLYSASNGVYSTQIQRLEQAGLLHLFDGMFISEKAGYEKPSLHFFEYCFENIPQLDKDKTIMVGDSISSDIQGAVNAGIDSCLFCRSGRPLQSEATHTIQDLSELISI